MLLSEERRTDSVRHAIGRFLRPAFWLMLCTLVVAPVVLLVFADSIAWRLRAAGLMLMAAAAFDGVLNYKSSRWRSRWLWLVGALIALAGLALLLME